MPERAGAGVHRTPRPALLCFAFAFVGLKSGAFAPVESSRQALQSYPGWKETPCARNAACGENYEAKGTYVGLKTCMIECEAHSTCVGIVGSLNSGDESCNLCLTVPRCDETSGKNSAWQYFRPTASPAATPPPAPNPTHRPTINPTLAPAHVELENRGPGVCGEAHIVAEVGDSDFVDERMALLCESYMNEMAVVYVVTDSFDGFVPGSPADGACSSHIRVLRTGMPELSKSKSTAQYRRAWVVDAYMAATPILSAHDEGAWVVLTEFDAWWEPRMLCKYIHFLEGQRKPGNIVVGGAGSGKIWRMPAEREDWASFVADERFKGGTPMPYGAMTVVPLSDLRLAFGRASEGAAACQDHLVAFCFADEGGDQCDSTTGEIECDVLCRSHQHRYDDTHFNNDHAFMACLARQARNSSRTISALWARRSDAFDPNPSSVIDSKSQLFEIGFSDGEGPRMQFKFAYHVDASMTEEGSAPPQFRNYVGAHHVSDEWLRSLLVTERTPAEQLLSHFHMPKTGGTTMSAALVSTFCSPPAGNEDILDRSNQVGWESRCQWPCSGSFTDRVYGPSRLPYDRATPFGSVASSEDAPHQSNQSEEGRNLEAARGSQRVVLDTEFSCLLGPFSEGISDRNEHGPFDATVKRSMALAATVFLQPASTVYILTIRQGTARAISHWSHCMTEASRWDNPARCTLGNVNLQPYRKLNGLFSSSSLDYFANGTYSPSHWTWFRHSNLQVGMLASKPSR